VCQVKDWISESTGKGAGSLEIKVADFDHGFDDGSGVCIPLNVYARVNFFEEIVEERTGSIEI